MTQRPAQPDASADAVAGHARASRSWLIAELRRCIADNEHAAADDLPESAGSLPNDSEAARKLQQFVAANPNVPFERVARQLDLTPFERNLLLLCVAVERSPDDFHELLRVAQPARQTAYPTFTLAHRLFGYADRAAMLPHRPLRRYRLIEVFQPAEQGLSISAVRVDEHIAAYAEGELSLNGAPRLDSMLALYVRPAPLIDPRTMAPSHRNAAAHLAQSWGNAGPRLPINSSAYISGPDPVGRLHVAAAAAQAVGRRLFVLGTDQLPAVSQDVDTLATLWKRDSLLYLLALYIDHGLGQSSAEGPHRAMLTRFHASLRNFGPIILATRDPWPATESELVFEIDKPPRDEQRALWIDHLPAGFDVTIRTSLAETLTWQFNLDAGAITRMAPHAADGSPENEIDPAYARSRLWTACRTASRPGLEGLARRVDARARWADIVLPDAQLQLLEQIAAQVRSRGRVYQDWGFADRSSRGLGIAALFAGDSGTGKTMAAEVIANDLDLDLYRIDLAAVVSKYIGETEKNLRRLFDGAEDGGAILLFDEADALFGKRSEVKDSHDRYSNIEVNYLLQRMEAYRGLAILATNMKSALDNAFLRRLRFTVNFPFPSLEDRRRIWSKAFPPQMLEALGKPDLDYARLARMPLAGGSIHSIALNAAFLAAGAKAELTTEQISEFVMTAARAEFIKIGKPFSESGYGPKPSAAVTGKGAT